MHRLTRYCAGWVTATTLATGVSWVAIQNLVTTAALSQPSAPVLAVAADAAADAEAGEPPAATPTRVPATTPAPRVTKAPKKPDPTRTAVEKAPRATATTGARANAPTVKGYSSPGGQVVLELTPTSVELVSAVPAAGYRTETWETEYWLRVDFVKDDRRSSLMASWYNQEPVIQETEF